MADIESSDNELPEKWLKLAYLANSGTIKEVRGLSQQQLNIIYRVGYSHYSSARYQEALIIFRYLSLLDHRCHAYLLALGSTLKAMRQYSPALPVLDLAEQANKQDPRAAVCKAACLIELNDMQSAINLLIKVESIAKKSPLQWGGLLQQIKRLKSFTDYQ
ncbi:MAG: hypothetical protein PUP46_10775 [Endozoicomonas sp. (ex Botrylloides leachii)]|nr:hypothetical protein [Endozoicomonas sp. (ex Botrylloides leachii)]